MVRRFVRFEGRSTLAAINWIVIRENICPFKKGSNFAFANRLVLVGL